MELTILWDGRNRQMSVKNEENTKVNQMSEVE
jgi:hypothetical protein